MEVNIKIPKHEKPLSACPLRTENEQMDDPGLLCPIWQLLVAI